MVVHPFHMGRHPADAAFEEGELEILIAVQQAGAEHAGESGHDRKYAGQDPVRKMVLEEVVDNGNCRLKWTAIGTFKRSASAKNCSWSGWSSRFAPAVPLIITAVKPSSRYAPVFGRACRVLQ